MYTTCARPMPAIRAVDGVSFAVDAGSITGLIGPNGSGKSTTIDCISGFQKPDGGNVVLAGSDITGSAPAGHRPRRTDAHLPERARLRAAFGCSTISPSRHSSSTSRPGSTSSCAPGAIATAVEAAETRARELVELDRPYSATTALEAGILSYGQKKLVALAAALMPHPKLVVLDEPVAGVNPSRIREVEDVLRRLNQAGETFLIVEHNVEFITNLCDNVIVLDQGRKLAEGPAAQVHQDARVLEAYLGLTPEMEAERVSA